MRGQNRPVYCFDKRGTFLQKYGNVKEAATAIRYSTVSVLANVNGRVKSVGDFVFSHTKVFPGYSHIKKSINQVERYSLTGKYLGIYPSVMDASKALNIDYTKIYRCIHDKTSLDTGYRWRYRKKQISRTYKPTPTTRPKIFQFSLSGKLLNSFYSITDAAQKTGIERRLINRCCLRQIETAGGFQWATSYFAPLPKS